MPRLATVALALIAVLGATAAAPAQRRMGISGASPPAGHAGPDHAGPGHAGPGHVEHRGSIGISGSRFGEGRNRRGFGRTPYFYGWPDSYPDGYDSYQGEPRAEQPAPQSAPMVQAKPEPLPDPVLLELQGNQWVRVGSFRTASNQEPGIVPPAPPITAKDMPPAVLVYRDGRTEEVSSYSIIGSVIYTKADYWTSGDWSRKIQIADLDVPATLRQNQQRGVKFDLPSGPNEVVIRP